MPRPTPTDIELLQNVQADDNIVMTTFNGHYHEWRVCEVSKVTMHRIYCSDVWCFTKRDGKQYGGLSTYRAWAYPATAENLARVENYKRERADAKLGIEWRRFLSRTSFRHTPIERLKLAVAILKDEVTFEYAIKVAWDAIEDMGRLAPSTGAALEAFEELEEDLGERIRTLEDYGDVEVNEAV